MSSSTNTRKRKRDVNNNKLDDPHKSHNNYSPYTHNDRWQQILRSRVHDDRIASASPSASASASLSASASPSASASTSCTTARLLQPSPDTATTSIVMEKIIRDVEYMYEQLSEILDEKQLNVSAANSTVSITNPTTVSITDPTTVSMINPTQVSIINAGENSAAIHSNSTVSGSTTMIHSTSSSTPFHVTMPMKAIITTISAPPQSFIYGFSAPGTYDYKRGGIQHLLGTVELCAAQLTKLDHKYRLLSIIREELPKLYVSDISRDPKLCIPRLDELHAIQNFLIIENVAFEILTCVSDRNDTHSSDEELDADSHYMSNGENVYCLRFPNHNVQLRQQFGIRGLCAQRLQIIRDHQANHKIVHVSDGWTDIKHNIQTHPSTTFVDTHKDIHKEFDRNDILCSVLDSQLSLEQIYMFRVEMQNTLGLWVRNQSFLWCILHIFRRLSYDSMDDTYFNEKINLLCYGNICEQSKRIHDAMIETTRNVFQTNCGIHTNDLFIIIVQYLHPTIIRKNKNM